MGLLQIRLNSTNLLTLLDMLSVLAYRRHRYNSVESNYPLRCHHHDISASLPASHLRAQPEHVLLCFSRQVLSILSVSHNLGQFEGSWRPSPGGAGADALIITIVDPSGAPGPPVSQLVVDIFCAAVVT